MIVFYSTVTWTADSSRLVNYFASRATYRHPSHDTSLNSSSFPPVLPSHLIGRSTRIHQSRNLVKVVAHLMPRDRRTLPILTHVSKAVVTLLDFERSILGSTRRDTGIGTDSPQISLSLSTWGYYTLAQGPDDFIDIFRDAPLEELDILVEARRVPYIDWRAVFALFPKLRVLRVCGRGYTPCMWEIFVGLNPALAPEGTPKDGCVVCPSLEHIRIEGFVASQHYFTGIVDCLKQRKVQLGIPTGLNMLSCMFDGQGKDEEFDAVTERVFVNAVSPFGGTLQYE